MRVVGLISGGKDSLYNMLQCIAAGHEIVAVANVEPAGKEEELDSYMYQTVGHHAISLVSSAMSLPIFRQKTKGKAVCKEKVYVETVGDEVEDLFVLLSKVKDEMHIEGVSVGAIESDYQRTRVENVCMRLDLQCLAYLWKRSQEELLQEMIEAEIHAIIVKVAAIGLKPEKHLGKSISDLQSFLVDLNKKFGVHVCGEGGEYETLTLDCPLYNRKIDIIESEKVIHSDDTFAPVGYLIIRKANLELKQTREHMSGRGRLDFIKSRVKSPLYYIQDCLDEDTTELSVENQVIHARASQDVLPFPFDSSSLETANDSKTDLPEIRKSKISDTSSLHKSIPQPSRPADTIPFTASNIDAAVTQINLSTGWCCVGNVTAPNIKDGLSVVRKHLERNYYEMRHIVSITLYVNDMKEFHKINKIYSQILLPKNSPPVRACVAVPLPHNVSVAITAVAHRLLSKAQRIVHYTQNTVDRDFIHVQSISNWAPANIGPYSQCIRVGEIVYVAGQIPLIPGTMELLGRSIPEQCRLALRHAFRIITAINETYTMANVMHGICFVVNEQVAAEVLSVWNCFTKNEHAAIASVVVSSLPKNADLEWQVLACGYNNPQVTTISEKISEEVVIKCKRCLYVENTTSSLVCNVTFVKHHSKKDKNIQLFSSDNLIAILKRCLQILRGDIDGSGTPLCMFNVFYKFSERAAVQAVNDILKNPLDFKVVESCIPVIACSEPDIFITITGVCH